MASNTLLQTDQQDVGGIALVRRLTGELEGVAPLERQTKAAQERADKTGKRKEWEQLRLVFEDPYGSRG